ncbi:hypothetical protein HMPREF1033_01971 [Tannerella sp. 6_1_58FAA_CT1]|jgi:hypothetical protein|nr:hypothetical protein HMPREF1033_01971 [Tannerella sp. 6_1_58FAA_CT1]
MKTEKQTERKSKDTLIAFFIEKFRLALKTLFVTLY